MLRAQIEFGNISYRGISSYSDQILSAWEAAASLVSSEGTGDLFC